MGWADDTINEWEYIDSKETKYLVFHRFKDPKKKTYDVKVRSNGYLLGDISWYAPWRRYAFAPVGGTIYDSECQITIGEYLQELMKERKKDV